MNFEFVFRKKNASPAVISNYAGPPPLVRPPSPRPEPCLNFGFQYTLIRNNWSKKFGVVY